MKAIFALLFSAFSLTGWTADDDAKVSESISAIRTDAERKRFEAIDKAQRAFRVAVAKTFQFADRVEVFLLDHSIGTDAAYKPKNGEEAFPIRPYNKETKILKTRKVPAKEIPKWCAAIAKTITTEKGGGGVLCHFPIHGLRIYARNELLFETSICWHCRNYYFEDEWKGLSEDAKDLRALLDDFMPVPEKEKARFPGSKPKDK
jgi:hypothetical protein